MVDTKECTGLDGSHEYEDVKNKKYIHNDETIKKIVSEAFEDVMKNGNKK